MKAIFHKNIKKLSDFMPKKERELKKNVNVRITEEQEKEWREYAKEKHFANLSTLVRWCVEEIMDGSYVRRSNSNSKDALKKEVEENKRKIQELMKAQRDILETFDKPSEAHKDIPLREYQKGVIINLLKEKPRDELELQKILSDLSEEEILRMINELMKASIVRQVKIGYEVR